MEARMRQARWIGWVLALGLLTLSCGLINTIRVGETESFSQAVDLGSANDVEIQVQMDAGELSITGDAGSLMDGDFRYNVATLKPQITYTENGSHGELRLDHQRMPNAIPVGKSLINQWKLHLNNAIPIDLVIETGAGSSVLNLSSLDLTGLRIDTAAGNTEIDLSGDLDHDLTATIHGGIGNVSVKLPAEMGVKISAQTGLGGLDRAGLSRNGEGYVNAAYGKAPHTLFLEIEAGVGSIELLAP